MEMQTQNISGYSTTTLDALIEDAHYRLANRDYPREDLSRWGEPVYRQYLRDEIAQAHAELAKRSRNERTP